MYSLKDTKDNIDQDLCYLDALALMSITASNEKDVKTLLLIEATFNEIEKRVYRLTNKVNKLDLTDLRYFFQPKL